MNTYTTTAATEIGTGQGVNGTGKRAKVSGFFVVNPQGRRCRAFTGKDAEAQAEAWAKFCNESFLGLGA